MMLQDWSYDEEESGRSETLVKTLDKVELLSKKLEIAVSYLELISGLKGAKCFQCSDFAKRAKQKIKDLDNEYNESK